jgi:hypothetical protein
MQKQRATGVLVLAAILSGGCAEGPYTYRPAQTTASLNGLPASRTSIPRDKPMGDVVVASSGVTEVQSSSAPARAIFVRVVVSNRTDDADWSFDTRKQTAMVAGQPVTAAYVNAYGGYEGKTSVVRVPRAQSRTVDFYFPIATSSPGDDEIPPFQLAWSVQTGREVVADRTPFQRVSVEPAYASPGYAYGYDPYYGPNGWYDPFWPPVYVGLHLGYPYPARYYGYPRPYYWHGGGRVFVGPRRR